MQSSDKSLTKAEGKLEKKRLREEMLEKERRQAKLGNLVTKLALLGLILAAGWWIYKASNVKQPGEAVADLGRNHVPEGTVVEYNSNPPTSGPHYAQWEKPGAYDRVLPDGRLIHSLEHGYIVISYNCTRLQISDFRNHISDFQAYAHETEEPHDEPATDSGEVDVSGWKDDQSCQNLVSQLKSVMEKSKAKRLILVPRPSLDTKMALTAWGRIDKMDDVDESRILRFIRAYHNKGPERTME